mmetsp:Transcript_58226/g.137038  ORF Transcript_58226/g.137038 Transcript_58226/m.137038 type:complete len:269 (-) Transcript_58226:131-937(-)
MLKLALVRQPSDQSQELFAVVSSMRKRRDGQLCELCCRQVLRGNKAWVLVENRERVLGVPFLSQQLQRPPHPPMLQQQVRCLGDEAQLAIALHGLDHELRARAQEEQLCRQLPLSGFREAVGGVHRGRAAGAQEPLCSVEKAQLPLADIPFSERLLCEMLAHHLVLQARIAGSREAFGRQQQMAVLLEVQALLVPLLCARLHRQRRVRLCAEVRQDLHQVLAVQEVEHRRPLRFVLFVDDHPHPGSSDGRVELLEFFAQNQVLVLAEW